MNSQRIFVIGLLLLLVLPLQAYRIEAGDYILSAGIGGNVSTIRFDVEPNATPGADLALITSFDYAIDEHFGAFGQIIPHFGPGSFTFDLRAGAKYWFNFLDAPYFPYVSLALAPSWLVRTSSAPNHLNIGVVPGVGVTGFLFAKITIGAHIHVNFSRAFVAKESKFEMAAMAFLDMGMKL